MPTELNNDTPTHGQDLPLTGPNRVTVKATIGSKLYTDQMPYLDEVKRETGLASSDIIRAAIDVLIAIVAAKDFQSEVRRLTNPSAITPRVDRCAEQPLTESCSAFTLTNPVTAVNEPALPTDTREPSMRLCEPLASDAHEVIDVKREENPLPLAAPIATQGVGDRRQSRRVFQLFSCGSVAALLFGLFTSALSAPSQGSVTEVPDTSIQELLDKNHRLGMQLTEALRKNTETAELAAAEQQQCAAALSVARS